MSLSATAPTIAGVAPVTPWQITVLGQDRGVIFLTFADDFTSAGYGISLDALGPFTMAGTWSEDADGNIVSGFTQYIEGASQAGLIEGRVTGNGGFIGQVKTTNGPQKFKAPAAADIPDLSGNWNGSVRSNGKTVFQSFVLTASTNNTPGWFDLTGSAIGDNGSFAIAGAVLVTSDRSAAGYTISNFGTGTLQASFVGKVASKTNKMTLRGKDENSQNVTFKAEIPKTK